MRLTTAIALGLIVTSSVPAFSYTPQDRRACVYDAFRLCAASIPDARRVATCLYVKRRQLSPACADAFARYAHTGTKQGRPRRTISDD